jgi:hypothetical protein
MELGEKLDPQLLLNEFILLQDLKITQAPTFSCGARLEHIEVVQTLHQCTVSDASMLKLIVFVLCLAEWESTKYVDGDGMEDLNVLHIRVMTRKFRRYLWLSLKILSSIP